MVSDKVFAGRVIFDHLPKTAGQAINAWLGEVLGAGCVTHNLIGNHRDLIRQYGGLYSVISAHVQFHDGDGFDPRYQYMTFFRDPVDRVVSWLYFVINNHDDSQLAELRASAIRFLKSDGQDISDAFSGSISNAYVEHFCRIKGKGSDRDEEKIANALTAIQQYDVVGVYQEMPRFLADVAALIGLPPPQEIARINVTTQRPQVDQISPALRESIVALNQLDLRLYAEVVAWRASVAKREPAQALPMTTSKWKKYDGVPNREVTTPDVTILSAVLREGIDIHHGQLITFDVAFFLSREVRDLEMGIHIFDSNRQWAFGINSSLLGQTHLFLPSGSYRASHHLVANLPAGKFTAGFAFAERLPEGMRELAWHDVMCEFQVHHKVNKNFAGYSYLPAEISLCPVHTPTNYVFQGDDSRMHTGVGKRMGHTMVGTAQAGCLIFGPYLPLLSGRYRVLIRCTLGEGGLAGARMDVVAEKGSRVIAECAFEEPDQHGCFIAPPLSLNTSCGDFEIRVHVNEETDLKISSIEIAPWLLDEVDGILGSESGVCMKVDRLAENAAVALLMDAHE